MASDATRLATEIAHILFMDIADFSLLSMEEQMRLTHELRDIVRDTPEFKRYCGDEDLMLCLDLGDGMALVFFRDPLAPVQCAIEIARALLKRPYLPLRMGIHSGPVSRVQDINGKQNVTGSGINTAQRVMDAGDAGYILLSNSMAEILLQFESWPDYLLDLGLCEVKHGRTLHLYNLCTDEIGHPEPPSRLRAHRTPPTEGKKEAETGKSREGIQWFRYSEVQEKPMPDIEPLNTRTPEHPNTQDLTPNAQHPTPNAQRLTSPPDAKTIALLYKRHSPEDERLLHILETELGGRGYSVFIDRNKTVGLEWASELARQMRSAYAVIPFLSADSIKSDMLAWELDMAHKAAKSQNGRPHILPVRVRYEGLLPAPLAAMLDSNRDFLWKSEADDNGIVQDLIAVLEGELAVPQSTISRPTTPTGN